MGNLGNVRTLPLFGRQNACIKPLALNSAYPGTEVKQQIVEMTPVTVVEYEILPGFAQSTDSDEGTKKLTTSKPVNQKLLSTCYKSR